MARLRLGLLLCALWRVERSVCVEEAMVWRRGELSDSSGPYWWRPANNPDDPQVSLTEPDDVWKFGETDAGSPYIWRTDEKGNPEVQLWRRGTLDSGKPYWWRTANGLLQEVRLSNPYKLVGSNEQGEGVNLGARGALREEL